MISIHRFLNFRGTKQNRTAVDGFADRYLTTRPWYRFVLRQQRYECFLNLQNFLHVFSGAYCNSLAFTKAARGLLSGGEMKKGRICRIYGCRGMCRISPGFSGVVVMMLPLALITGAGSGVTAEVDKNREVTCPFSQVKSTV